jgi:rhodanese-related sulfurtransferase
MFRSVFKPALFPAVAVAARNAATRSAAIHTLRPLSAGVARPTLSAVQRPAGTWIFGSARRYSPITTDEPAEILEFPQVQELLTKKPENTVIVDVREPSEFAEGHIPTAINIPVKSSPGALGLEAEEFHDTFGFDKPDHDKTLVFYCLAGVRSTTAEELACTFGYQK